jgi:hypothetical protein
MKLQRYNRVDEHREASAVQVWVQVERRPKALGKRDRAAKGVDDARLFALSPIPALHHPQKHREHFAEQTAVAAQSVAYLKGQTQHPLTHGSLRREYVLYQTRRGVGHAPSLATWA